MKFDKRKYLLFYKIQFFCQKMFYGKYHLNSYKAIFVHHLLHLIKYINTFKTSKYSIDVNVMEYPENLNYYTKH